MSKMFNYPLCRIFIQSAIWIYDKKMLYLMWVEIRRV